VSSSVILRKARPAKAICPNGNCQRYGNQSDKWGKVWSDDRLRGQDEILAVGASENIAEGAEKNDGTGKFVIPGLWDTHVHLTASNFFDGSLLPLLLSYGISSVRDTSGMLEDLLPLVETRELGFYPGHWIFDFGPLLDGEFVVYDGSGLFRPNTGTMNTVPEKAVSTVAELKGVVPAL